jgi:hypothetical protein
MPFSTIFLSWWSILLQEENGEPVENWRPATIILAYTMLHTSTNWEREIRLITSISFSRYMW